VKMSIDLPRNLGFQRFSLNGETMGTRYSVLFYAEAGTDVTALGSSVQAAVDAVDCQMSNWKPDSDLNRLNLAPVGAWVDLPSQILTVLQASIAFHNASEGAFDIAVGGIVSAFGFGPDMIAVDRLAQPGVALSTGPAFELDAASSRVRRLKPVQLDLCGIAKGYGVDEIARCLEEAGIHDYLVGIDGDMRAHGTKPMEQPWAIALEQPDYHARQVRGVLALENAAVATSGDYRHWKQGADRLISHTMDPRLGAPVANRLASVSVLAQNCMEADAWATVLMVLGETDGPAFARSKGLDALFLVRNDETFDEIAIGKVWA
jgi:FAD:protein FMN transferase